MHEMESAVTSMINNKRLEQEKAFGCHGREISTSSNNNINCSKEEEALTTALHTDVVS